MRLRFTYPLFVASVAVAAIAGISREASAQSSSEELVRQARVHETAHEDDVAVRRYNDALRLDPTNGDAYLGLGALRLRTGDLREAERVFSVALEHVPSLRRALAGRARARWGLGLRDAAMQEMELYSSYEASAPALRDLADWYGEEGRTPAQLSAWRRVLVLAVDANDGALTREARIKVRALQILVGPADPAAAPHDPSPIRRVIAAAAKRGG